MFFSTLFTAVLRILNVVLTFTYGIKALLIGEIFVLLLNMVVFSLLGLRKMGVNYLTTLKELWITLVATGIIYFLGEGIEYIMRTTPEWMMVISTAAGMMAAYVAVLLVIDRKNLKLLIQNVVKMI